MITICPITKAARRLLALPRALSAGTGGCSPCPCVCPHVPVCVPVCVPVSLSPPRPHTGPSGARRQMAVRGSGAAGRTRKVSRSEPPARPPSLPPPPLPALPARMEPLGMAATAVPDAGPGPGWQSKVRAGGGRLWGQSGGCRPLRRCWRLEAASRAGGGLHGFRGRLRRGFPFRKSRNEGGHCP